MSLVTRKEAIAALTAPGTQYELQVLESCGRAMRVFTNAPANLGQLYADSISDADFLVYEHERLTFAQTYRCAARIARVLIDDYGVEKGDRVAIAMRNYPEWVLAFMAVTSIGAIAVAVNALWQADELHFSLQDSGAQVVFTDQERLDRMGRFAREHGLGVLAVRPTRPAAEAELLAERLRSVGDVPMPASRVYRSDPATIFYTSGSTGRPKGVLSTHRSLISALMSWELEAAARSLVAGSDAVPTPDQPAVLLAVPLFHVTGCHAVCLRSYRAQRKMVCMYKWDPLRAAELIEHERVNALVGPAAITSDLTRVAKESARDLSSLQSVGGGGAPRAPEQVREIDGAFATAVPSTGWGMTETNSIGTHISGPDYLTHPASSGYCSPIMDLKVVDEQGLDVDAGKQGELLVRGTAMFREYWNRPDASKAAFDGDGWFRTGDIAVIDDDGLLYIVDRIKDLIIRGGENIGSGQVEAALLMHPDIYEAAVYGIPDKRLGELVGATIYARPTLNLDALRSFLDQHLARFEIPSHILTVSQPLPRTASGKIHKRELRDQAIAMATVTDDGSPDFDAGQ